MRFAALLSLFCVVAPTAARAQDVEMLGVRYGTRPPAAYYEIMARDSGAFQFVRGRTARLRASYAAENATDPGLPSVLGPRSGPVVGTFKIPVILGLFSDSPDSVRYQMDTIQSAYFGAGPGTITDFYGEISGGRVTLQGEVIDWTRGSFTQAQATGGESGLKSGTTGSFILQLLARLNGIDWGLYDNDGPDGIPNSGDDDGFVDALAVIQPTPGGECGGSERANRIWSHRWNLRSSAGQMFTTAVPANGGSVGFIRIDDYLVQPVFACNGSDLSEIGVFSHELGHAFGLPDLYDTRKTGKHAGAGSWELMASGSWGCAGSDASSPCHMGAWSKSVLGWANVVTLASGTDHGLLSLAPVETANTVYRVDAGDGTDEYFLLENRQRLGYDQDLYGEGLLVWQIDPDWIAARWGSNAVNAADHRGVWLRQADGRDQLGQAGGGRGDSGDPFPWLSGGAENRSFHAASSPAAMSQSGTATGLTLTDVQVVGDDVQFRLSTRFTSVSIRPIGDDGSGGLFTVDGTSVPTQAHAFRSAPFAAHEIRAAPGEGVSQGVRTPFLRWSDDASAPATRNFVTPLVDVELVAEYGGREIELAITHAGGVSGIEPGSFQTTPASADLWFSEGAAVTVQAVPERGFGFVEWTGALQGQANPASVTMSAPLQAGATFEVTFDVPDAVVEFPAAETQNVSVVAGEGTNPFFWSLLQGTLPEGIIFTALGQFSGSALETGTFPLVLQARDGLGLSAEGEIRVEVTPPEIGLAALASAFLQIGSPLSQVQKNFLDKQGNANGAYDLGDFRAWVLDTPGLPFTADVRALLGLPRIGESGGGR